MIYIDTTTLEQVASVDLNKGYISNTETEQVYYKYIVDEEAVIDYEIVATFENGGKEYRESIKAPEVGHWEVLDKNGNEFTYQIEVPEGLPKTLPVPDEVTIGYWKPYSEEHFEEIRKEEEESEKMAKFYDALPETISATDMAVCDLYEASMEQEEIIAGQDAAICELYEMLTGE